MSAMSQWSRDILNDPPLTGYNKSALLGNTFWRVCIPEIQRQSCVGGSVQLSIDDVVS